MASLTSMNSLPSWVKLSLHWDNQTQLHWPYRNWTTCTRKELASLGQLLSWLICHAILLDSLGLNEIQKRICPRYFCFTFFFRCVNWLYSNGLQHHTMCCHCLKILICFWNKICPLQRQWKHVIFNIFLSIHLDANVAIHSAVATHRTIRHIQCHLLLEAFLTSLKDKKKVS